jgi:hypothetical protein
MATPRSQDVAQSSSRTQNIFMTVSRLRVSKSETRDLADRERAVKFRMGEPSEWETDGGNLFTVFVSIAAVAALIFLLVRM